MPRRCPSVCMRIDKRWETEDVEAMSSGPLLPHASPHDYTGLLTAFPRIEDRPLVAAGSATFQEVGVGDVAVQKSYASSL